MRVLALLHSLALLSGIAVLLSQGYGGGAEKNRWNE